MKTHELKSWPEFFAAVADGVKRYEFRRDDRGFEVGDVLILREWDPARATVAAGVAIHDEGYTGRSFACTVLYLQRGGALGIPEGFVVLSLGGYR